MVNFLKEISTNFCQYRDLDGQNEKKKSTKILPLEKSKSRTYYEMDFTFGEKVLGWHLECTAMSTKYLGEQFDIHGGGMDLKFPHHECEIAQGKGCNGVSPVKYWMHANMLTMNGLE